MLSNFTLIRGFRWYLAQTLPLHRVCRFIQALFRSNLFTQPNKNLTEIHFTIEPNIQINSGQAPLWTSNQKRAFANGFRASVLWFACVYLRQELFAELIKVILNHLANIHKQVYPSLSWPLSWSVLMSRTPALAADLTVQMDARHSSLFSCICLPQLPLSLCDEGSNSAVRAAWLGARFWHRINVVYKFRCWKLKKPLHTVHSLCHAKLRLLRIIGWKTERFQCND